MRKGMYSILAVHIQSKTLDTFDKHIDICPVKNVSYILQIYRDVPTLAYMSLKQVCF